MMRATWGNTPSTRKTSASIRAFPKGARFWTTWVAKNLPPISSGSRRRKDGCAGSTSSARMQPSRRIIAWAARCATPSSDWGRPCPKIFLRLNLFVGSLKDRGAPDRRSRNNNKRTRIAYSSMPLLKGCEQVPNFPNYRILCWLLGSSVQKQGIFRAVLWSYAAWSREVIQGEKEKFPLFLCWLLRISVLKKSAHESSTSSFSWPSRNQIGGVKTVSFLILERIS